MIREVGYISPHQHTEEDIAALARQIIQSGYHWDFRVPVSTNGAIVSEAVTRITKWTPSISLPVMQDTEGRKIVGHAPWIDPDGFKGRKVLVVEDFLESGNTALAIKDYLERCGAEFKLACLFSRRGALVVPDFVLAADLKEPVIFPWDRFKSEHRIRM